MSHLTMQDLQPERIQAQRVLLAELDQKLDAVQAKKEELLREEESLSAQRAAVAMDIVWRELMFEAEGDGVVDEMERAVREACEAFKASVAEPEGYAQSAAEGGEALVPYSETDDYADFSIVEAVVEEYVNDIKEHLTSSCPSSAATPRAGVSVLDAQQLANRRRSLLRLLVLSVLVGRLNEMCELDQVKECKDVLAEWDDMKEELTDVWQTVLYGASHLPAEEAEKWKYNVTSFLGEPFDSPP